MIVKPDVVDEDVVLVVDTNLGLEVARRLGEDGYETYYAVVHADPYPKLEDEICGYGFPEIKKIMDWGEGLDAGAGTIVFIDSGFGAFADWLRSLNYNVFGSDSMSEKLELDRVYVRNVLSKLGIDVPPADVVKGIKRVVQFLEFTKEFRFIKVSRFRGCFAEGTEVFTKQGWKDFKDITMDDELLTMNPDTGEVTFVKPKAVIKYWYDGVMYEYNGKTVKFLVTPNHGFVVKKNHGERHWKYRLAYDLKKGSRFFIPVTFKWHGKHTNKFVIDGLETTTRKYTPIEVDMDNWLKFLGWFIAEGHIEGSEKRLEKHKYRVLISQSKSKNPQHYNEIKKVVETLGFSYCEDQERAIVIHNKQLWSWLRNNVYVNPDEPCVICGRKYCAHKKKVPQFIKELSPDQIRIFLNTFLKGDGYITQGEKRYVTSSKQLVDDLTELILKTGKSVCIHIETHKGEIGGNINGRELVAKTTIYYVSELGRNTRMIEPQNIKEVEYHGYVYDVTVEPYHTILVRYKGTVWWSGNSVETFGTDDPKEAEMKLRQGGLAILGDDVWFVLEKMLTGVEVGVDCFFNGREFLSPVFETIELKGCGNITKPVEIEDSLWYDTLVKLEPYLMKNGYRGMFCLEGFYDGSRLYVTDITPRFPWICGYAYPKFIGNFSEVILSVAKGEDIRPRPIDKFSAQIGVYTDMPDRWGVIRYRGDDEDWIVYRRVIKIDEDIWFVPGDYVVAVGVSAEPKWRTAITTATRRAKNVSFPSSYYMGYEFLNYIDTILNKLEGYGYEF